MSILILFFLLVLMVTGCSQPGQIEYRSPGGETIEVLQSGKAVAPATLTLGRDGGVVISTGNQQEMSASHIAASQSWVIYLIGGGLVLLGVVALGIKATPWGMMLGIPTTAGTTAIIAGAGLIVVTYAAMTIPWWVYAILAGIALVIIAPSWMATKKDKSKLKPKAVTT